MSSGMNGTKSRGVFSSVEEMKAANLRVGVRVDVYGGDTYDIYATNQGTSIPLDNGLWAEVVVSNGITPSELTTAQNDIVGGSIFKGSNGEYVKNGDVVPVGTTHLRVLVGGEPKIVRMGALLDGLVSGLTESSVTIGGTTTTLHEFLNGGYQATNAELLVITPAMGEMWFNTTDNTIHMGDGVTQGGIKHLNVDSGLRVFDSVTDMQSNDVKFKTGQRIRTMNYNAPVISDWLVVQTLTGSDFGVPVNNGLFAKLVSSPTLRAIGCYVDGTNFEHNDTLIQSRIDAGQKYFYLERDSELAWRSLTLEDDVVFEGECNLTSTMKTVQPTVAGQVVGFRHPNGNRELKGNQLITLCLDGDRIANPVELFTSTVNFELSGTDRIADFLAYRCWFKNAQEDFIRVIGLAETVGGDRVKAVLCKFTCDDDLINLPGNGVPSSGNALRVWLRADFVNNYGTTIFHNFSTNGCYAENIRTLSDFKRGCKSFQILNNETKNLLDVHHSVDGSFDGVINGNVGRNDPDFTLGGRPNMFEVQGEEIVITSNEFDGGLATTSFILVSDFGEVDEDGVGHVSRAITVANNIARNTTSVMYKFLNCHNSSFINNKAKNGGSHSFTIESGTGRLAPDKVTPLVSTRCNARGNEQQDCVLPLLVAGTQHNLGSNPNQRGEEDIYIPGNTLRKVVDYAPFKQTDMQPNMNDNFNFDLNGTDIIHWTTPEPAAASADYPDGLFSGVTMTDTSTTANREHILDTYIPVEPGDVRFASMWIKKNTATQCSVLFQEYDAAKGFLSSTFHAIQGGMPDDWERYICNHTVSNGNAAFVRVSLVPAASSNSPIQVGSTDFAGVYIGKSPVGLL